MRVSGKPVVVNGTLTLANTEYGIELPLNVHKFILKARTLANLKISFSAGTSGSEYFSIPSGNSYSEDGVRTNNYIYIQSPTAGTVVEIIAWSGGDDL